MASIRFENLEKRFGEVTVMKDVDLTIEDREFFTFVGPSGCGKSTILNLMAGLEEVTRGTIYFDDQVVNNLSPGERDVAMVFQSYALYPHMSVFENIAFPLKIQKHPKEKIDEEVERVARTLGLESMLDRRPKELSGGQRQRVALGRAIVRKPKVFLMDEPLSNLDARLRLEMREELKRLHDQYKTTTIYVTHDQEEAMVMSDRIAILSESRIQQCGTPKEVYEEPVNLFVAQFIGSPPINILDGTLIDEVEDLKSLREKLPDKEVVIGVRPADIDVYASKREGALAAEVTLLEPTGSDLWVVGRWHDQRIKGRAVSGEELSTDQKAYFRIPSEKVYAFDKETEERLL